MNAHNLCKLIAAAHAAPEWVTLFEIRDGAGWDRRSADAVAMNLWKSRGLTLRGFEVKVSRSDLRREHADPSKAEGVAQFCDEWWLVTPKGLTKDVGQDVPVGWGLMESDEECTALRTVRAAVRNPEPQTLTRGFLAQMLKGAARMVSRENNEWVKREEIAGEIEKAVERGMSLVPREAQFAKDQAARLEKTMAEFLRLTGIDLTSSRYRVDVKAIAKAYRLGLGLLGDYGNRLPLVIRTLEGLGNVVKSALKDLAPLQEQIDAAGEETRT